MPMGSITFSKVTFSKVVAEACNLSLFHVFYIVQMVPNRTKHHIFSTVEGIHHSSLLNNVTHRPQIFYKEIA